MSPIAVAKQQMAMRPLWMNAIFLFCIYMTFIYLPWDVLLKPLSEDQEVWFGLLFTGWAAKVGGVLHWIVYAAATYGYWKMKRWMHPWAIVYSLQIAVGMFIWSFMDARSGGLLAGTVVAAFFGGLALISWRARAQFSN